MNDNQNISWWTYLIAVLLPAGHPSPSISRDSRVAPGFRLLAIGGWSTNLPLRPVASRSRVAREISRREKVSRCRVELDRCAANRELGVGKNLPMADRLCRINSFEACHQSLWTRTVIATVLDGIK